MTFKDQKRGISPLATPFFSSLLGLSYYNQSKYQEAEPLYRRSLTIREKVLGPEHPDVGITLHNLAAVCRDQGRYVEAEPLYKRSLLILENALGLDHSSVVQSLEEYAALLRKTKRGAEAAKMESRAQAIRAKTNPKK